MLRPFMSNYTFYPDVCCWHLPPPHSESMWVINGCNPGRKIKPFSTSHYQSKNETVTAQLCLYKTFNELPCHELLKKHFNVSISGTEVAMIEFSWPVSQTFAAGAQTQSPNGSSRGSSLSFLSFSHGSFCRPFCLEDFDQGVLSVLLCQLKWTKILWAKTSMHSSF